MQLRPYQVESVDFLTARRFALLAHEMRVGKTPCAIVAAEKAGAKTVLVTCPAIAVPHWRREFERWWKGPMPRAQVWSYDRAREEWQGGRRGAVDVFIPDEAHFAKNPTAARTKMVYGKTGFATMAGAVWPLSGTPAPKHAAELWPMLRAFGVVKMTYDEFIHRYCRVDSLGVIRGTRVEMIPELKALLATIMLRRTRKEVAPEMPGIDFQFLEVKPTGDAALGVPPGLSDEDLLAWLESHPTAGQDDRIAVANAKVPALFENIRFAIENGLLAQTVVFGWHVEPLTRLAGMLNVAGIQSAVLNGATTPRNKAIIQRQFHEGFTKVLCANILSAGTAIDLSPARHGYFLELDWVPGNNVQAASRMVSMEKMDKVTADVCTWPGSMDDRVQGVLMRRVRELALLY